MAVPPNHWTHVDYGYSDIGEFGDRYPCHSGIHWQKLSRRLIAPALLETLNAPQGQLGALRDTMDKLGRGHHRLDTGGGIGDQVFERGLARGQGIIAFGEPGQ